MRNQTFYYLILQTHLYQKLVAYGLNGKSGRNAQKHVTVVNKKENEENKRLRTAEKIALGMIGNMKHVMIVLVQVRRNALYFVH